MLGFLAHLAVQLIEHYYNNPLAKRFNTIYIESMKIEKLRETLAALERQLYSSAILERERAEDLSMQVSIARARYARAIRVPLWTATAAPEGCNADD